MAALLGAMLVLTSCPGDEPNIELSVSPTNITLDSSNQAEITISSNTSWTIKTTDTSWLTVTSTSGMGNRQVTVKATSDNTDSATRSAQVVVSDKTGSQTRAVTVNQPPSGQTPTPTPTPTPTYNLSVSKSSLFFDSDSGEDSFEITSNVSWSVSSSQTWCSVLPSQGSNGNTIKVSVTKNDSDSNRTATITVSATDNSVSSCIIQVSQSGNSNTENQPNKGDNTLPSYSRNNQ